MYVGVDPGFCQGWGLTLEAESNDMKLGEQSKLFAAGSRDYFRALGALGFQCLNIHLPIF